MTLSGKPKVGGVELRVDQGVVHGDESSPCAAHTHTHGIHSLDYTAPLGQHGHKRTSPLPLKVSDAKKIKMY